METTRRPSALENLLKIFGLSNSSEPAQGDDVPADTDEPPEHPPRSSADHQKQSSYIKHMAPPACVRRESLLTRAILDYSKPTDSSLSISSQAVSSRAMSTASSQSLASTGELTSDCDLTSPARSASPSPPLMTVHFPRLNKKDTMGPQKVTIVPSHRDEAATVTEAGEAAVEKSLGRKRCIMFACADVTPEAVKEPVKESSQTTSLPPSQPQRPQFESRRSRLTFVCPTRPELDKDLSLEPARPQLPLRQTAPPTASASEVVKPTLPVVNTQAKVIPTAKITSPVFHEFGTSQDETDAWMDEPEPQGPRLTIDDCNQKENVIRRIAKEAEEEADAEAEELAEDDMDEELDEEDVADDFEISDEESDGGNESDDEGGFADSDDESDDGSEYQFWAPAAGNTTSSNDNLTYFSSRRSRSGSVDSVNSHSGSSTGRMPGHLRKSKAIRMRPGTPELPDSTDFVCGTLDEDRPLEAAFIACREQRLRNKHITIPQDIDPSFPTSDPEDDQDDDDDEAFDPQRVVDQLLSEESSGRRPSAFKTSPVHTPAVVRPEISRPVAGTRKPTNRSPPPPRHRSPPPPRHRSPAPRRLFGQSPTRLRSPPPAGRYRSPRGSPNNMKLPLGITINRLAQRPNTTRTASLPHTPNPFFRNWERGSPPVSRISSAAVTPGTETEGARSDMHVRGPVDIVIGLEKKRQKRKEKLWRQHCRKAAKEHAERKPVAGRGVERMKELGLECAERTRGYGLGQQAQLVLSL